MKTMRNSSDSPPCNQSKKFKTIHQIEAPSHGEIPNFPEEIMVEILAGVPVKSLLKFRCVSKSWRYLISSSQFIKTHLKNSKNRVMLTISKPHFNLKHCSLHSLMFETQTALSSVDCPKKMPQRGVWNWVVGSCNGLICIAIDRNNKFLWNPSTRKSKKLPPVTVPMKVSNYYLFGFGYSEADDDYKVVDIFYSIGNSSTYEPMVQIYSLNANFWKRIEGFEGGIPLDNLGKFESGKLHFRATCRGSGTGRAIGWNIVSLDLRSEEYGMVELPNYGEDHFNMSLGVLGGCICVLYNDWKTGADVWVLKDYGVKGSWSKVVTVPYITDPSYFFNLNPLCLMPSGEILFVISYVFVVYNPKDSSVRYPEIRNLPSFVKAFVYVESLVSLQAEDRED